MPNWCVNRIKISGKPETIQKIVEDIQNSHKVIMLQNQAIQAAIKLFISYEYNLIDGFNGSKCGVKFKCLLNNHEILTEDICKEILAIFNKSGADKIVLSDLSASKLEKVVKILETQCFDWLNVFNFQNEMIDKYWKSLDPCFNNVEEKSSIPFVNCDDDNCEMFKWNFYSMIPLPIDVAINGFNGKLYKDKCSVYNWNINNLGTKWSVIEAFPIKLTDDSIWIEFDSAWSPVIAVSEMLSAQYQCDVNHIYAEQGMGFCGNYTFVNGELIEEICGDKLIFSEEDESGWPKVIGPSYILELGHFGG